MNRITFLLPLVAVLMTGCASNSYYGDADDNPGYDDDRSGDYYEAPRDDDEDEDTGYADDDCSRRVDGICIND